MGVSGYLGGCVVYLDGCVGIPSWVCQDTLRACRDTFMGVSGYLHGRVGIPSWLCRDTFMGVSGYHD